MNINKIFIFIDGSALNNGKKYSIGSIGIYIPEYNIKIGKLISNINFKITNQTMELSACIEALEIINNFNDANNDKILYICTDSTYIINSITKWYHKWEHNNWKTSKGSDVSNKELINKLFLLKKNKFIIFKHVKAHTVEPSKDDEDYDLWYGNYMADKLATECSKNYKHKLKENKLNDINKEINDHAKEQTYEKDDIDLKMNINSLLNV